MIRATLFSKLVALSLSLVLCGAAAPVLAAGDATISGTIASLEEGAPLAGARVYAADPRTGDVRSSTPSGENGAFEIRGLPASSYQLAVESAGGLYVVEPPVAVGAGQERAIHLAVGPKAARETTEPGKTERRKAAFAIWDNPITATLLVVGSAVIVGLLIGTDDDNQASVSPTEP